MCTQRIRDWDLSNPHPLHTTVPEDAKGGGGGGGGGGGWEIERKHIFTENLYAFPTRHAT